MLYPDFDFESYLLDAYQKDEFKPIALKDVYEFLDYDSMESALVLIREHLNYVEDYTGNDEDYIEFVVTNNSGKVSGVWKLSIDFFLMVADNTLHPGGKGDRHMQNRAKLVREKYIKATQA